MNPDKSTWGGADRGQGRKPLDLAGRPVRQAVRQAARRAVDEWRERYPEIGGMWASASRDPVHPEFVEFSTVGSQIIRRVRVR